MAMSARSAQVAAAVAEWRASLINVDANNRLLYYRDLKVGTLDLADADPIGVEQLRRGQAVRLGRIFPDAARLMVAQRSVRQIANKARAAEEEFGVPISFLACGLATWDDGRGSSAPTPTRLSFQPEVTSGEPSPPTRRTPVPAAPVLLQGMGFEARPGTPDGYQLTALGEAFVNPVLVHVLASQFAVDVDEEELLEAAGDDAMVFSLLGKACHDVPAFDITERILIGTFSYMKQPMVEDLDADQIEFLSENDLIAALAGVSDARDAVKGAGGEVSEVAPDFEPPVNEFLVLDADASQSYVINAASAGQHLVVQGPPGTGKSQTIANLIADLVAHGKSVLFVAQKRAAITAVLHRLELVGLDALALDMFEGAGSRKTVVTKLGIALEEKANARTVATDALHARWTAARDQLTAHQTALHEARSPWGISLWQLIAIERGLPQAAASNIRISVAILKGWSSATADELASVGAELAASGGCDPRLLQRKGWGIDAFETLEELTAAHQLAEHLVGAALPRAFTSVATITRQCGLASPANMAQLVETLKLLSDTVAALTQGCGPALSTSVTDGALLSMIHATADREWRKTNKVVMSWGDRRAGKKAARGLFGGEIELAGAHQRLLSSFSLRKAWTAAGAPTPVAFEPTTLAPAPVAEAQDAANRLGAGLQDLQPRVQGYALAELSFAELDAFLRAVIADPDRTRLPRIHVLRAQLVAGGLKDVLAELDSRRPEEGALDPATVEARVRYVFAMSLSDHILSTDPRLAGVTRIQLDRWATEFFIADGEHLRANAARVRRIAAERMAEALNDFPDQHAEIKRQVRRKRGFSSVRRLFKDAPDVLVAIKPCWAMSPLMVSQMLPAEQLFDVVIFDEASQVMPADAIPAIARGPQLVVAGDRHQLPPTDFFSKLSLPGDGDPDEEVSDDDEAIVTVAPETRDVDSILDALDVVLAGRSRTLTWHYRSKDEKLIATSNAYVYHNQLITFPGSDGSDRIHFEPVEFSTGLGRNNKSPSAEVARVVDLAVDHARSRPLESLGIIAFGSDHAARIEGAIDARLREEPELREFFQQSGDEPFFIKNIERVQGDEREAIILTVGYGKSNDGRMRYMWGPLLGQGGERRLNVAITRARSRLTLVSSFTADDIDPEANRSAGFELMYRFVQFMGSDGASFGGAPGRDVELNPFEVDVLNRLTAAGLSLEPQWGVGNYRIDFAVRHPMHPGRFVLAIECDGAMYHSGVIARERDRLRQQHLENLGWRFHRIWSTEWWHDPLPQIDAVLANYQAALERKPTETSEEKPTSAPAVITEAPSRSGLRPHIWPGSPITEYTHTELVRLIRWIKSDDVVRTDDELFEAAIQELGYSRRGQRIVTALQAAIATA